LKLAVALVLLSALSTSHADVLVLSDEGETSDRRPGFRLDAFTIDGGSVNLQEGDYGPLLGATVGLGTLFASYFDFSLGARYWWADIDRSGFGDAASGSVTNFSVHPDLRLATKPLDSFRPYLVTGPSFQFATADIPDDSSLENALGGFRVGFDAGVGLALVRRGIDFRAEGRREFVEDIGNWNFVIGIGFVPETHAKRPPELRVATQAPLTPDVVLEPPAVTPSAPPPAATPGDRSSELQPLVRELIQDNQALRAELEEMRRHLAEERETAAPAPTPPPAPTGPSLRLALERVAALSAGTTVEPTAHGVRYVLGGPLTFDSGSATLSASARDDIRRLATTLMRYEIDEIVVEGHTDSSGDASRNHTLSSERAVAVRNELVLLGVDPAIITSRGFGSMRPITDNATPDARARNRRVELHVIESLEQTRP